jgi:glycolate oxidase iron-sulfur subunit
MHLIDHARAYIDEHYDRPWSDRASAMGFGTDYSLSISIPVGVARCKDWRAHSRALFPINGLRAMIAMAPKRVPPVSRNDDPQTFQPKGAKRKRVALMTGCAQRALNTDINDATLRLLQRLGCEIVIPQGQGCCGALTHHMGKTDQSHASACGQYPRMDGRGPWPRVRCDCDQYQRMRHHGQGLRPYVPRHTHWHRMPKQFQP